MDVEKRKCFALSVTDKLKYGLFQKLIASVPPELDAEFNQLQLKNNIYRIKILSTVMVAAKLINKFYYAVFIVKPAQILDVLKIFDYIDSFELIGIIFYHLLISYFSKKNKSDTQLWVICYLFIILNFILSALTMMVANTSSQIPFIYFISAYVFTLIPDFKPKKIMWLTVLFYFTTVSILLHKNQLISDYAGAQSFTLNIFFVVVTTKLLLHNNKVKTYVNTFKMNELNKKLASANEKLEALSVTDELTRLYNRRYFLEHMNLLWKQDQNLTVPINALMIDVDYFKKYNDSMGHLEGDKALISVAQCLKNQLKRETDFVARFGGEEFVCLLPFVEKDEALDFAKELVRSVENIKIPHPMSEHSKYITISVGMASVLPCENNSHTQLLDEADKALYMAKESGRNRVVVI